MNKKQILILLALFVVVLTSVGFLFVRGSSDWDQGALEKLIPDFRSSDVQKVVIIDGDTRVTMEFNGSKWGIREKGGYLVNRAKLAVLLDKLEDVKVVEWRADEEEVADGVGLGKLDNPIHLTLYDKAGRLLHSLYVGDRLLAVANESGSNPFNNGGKIPKGRFVRFGGVDDRIALVDDPLVAVRGNPINWLDGQFIWVDKIKAIGVARRNPAETWELTRHADGGTFKMVGQEEGMALNFALARDKVGTFFSKNVIDFKDVLPGDTADDITGFDNPESRVQIKTFADVNFTFLIGDEFEGTYFVKILDVSYTPPTALLAKDKKAQKLVEIYQEYQDKYSKWVYRIPAEVIEPVLLNRSQLLISTEDLLRTR